MIRSRRAFSLVEILIGMVFLAFALLGLLWMNQSSSRGAMDSQFELLAFCLAQEPIEVFQHLGFAWIQRLQKGETPPLPGYPVGQWQRLTDPPFATVQRPVDAVLFQRRIDVDPQLVERDGVRAWRLTVTLAPVAGGRAGAWLTRNRIVQEALIVEETP